MGRDRLPGLDALRGIAALIVTAYHLQLTYDVRFVALSAISAVDLFFVISGFVMARTFDARLATSLGAAGFLRLRYRRLIPCMGIGSLLGFLLVGRYDIESLAALLAIFAFLPFPYLGTLFALNIPAWSLFTEIVANALHRLLRTRVAIAVLVLCWLVFVPATLERGNTFWGSDAWSLMIATARGIACYIMGLLTYRTWGDAGLGRPWLAFIGVPALLALGPLLPASWFAIGFVALAPLIVRAAVGFRGHDFGLGVVSFPIYAVHFPVGQFAHDSGLPIAAAAAMVMLATLVLVFAVEKPKLLRKPLAGAA